MKLKAKLTERDEALFHFLWRWKLATTRNLALAFYPGRSFRAAYVRLWRLERAGWLSSFTAPNGRDHFWTLSDACFRELVMPKLSGLIQIGYKSESMEHDFLVNAIHLGEWLRGIPANAPQFTEQELRRIDPEFYPDWVPQSQIHRPDGYTLMGDRLLAFEVELSQKKLEVYENVGRFYVEDTRVTDVIWVVAKVSQARSILKRIEAVVGRGGPSHSFLLVDQIQSSLWQAKFIVGRYEGQIYQNAVGISPETSRNHVSDLRFFDTRKSLRESSSRTNSENRIHVNREALLLASQKPDKGIL